MNNVTKIILIIIGVVVIFGGGVLVYFAYQEQQGNETIFTNLFPNTGDSQNNLEPDDNDITILPDTNTNTDTNTGERTQMFQITQAPVVGYTLIKSGSNVVVRYMEGGTGNIYDYDIATGNQIKTSNKTIDRVKEIVWGRGGDEFITRQITEGGVVINTHYSHSKKGANFFFESTLSPNDNNEGVRNLQKTLNEDPETLVAQNGIGSPGEESSFYGVKTTNAVKRFQEKYFEEVLTSQNLTESTGVFDETTRQVLNNLLKPEDTLTQEIRLSEKSLSGTIHEIVASPDGSQIFYLQKKDGGGVSGILANFNNTNQKEIFNSLFTEWAVSWSKDNAIYLTSKASSGVFGSTYTLNPENGLFRKLFGDIPGLITKGGDGVILYSKSEDQGGGISTHLFEISENKNEVITLATLAEKCAWNKTQKEILYCGVPNNTPPGVYPDDWYKGLLSFSDVIWEYDTKTRVQQIIINPEASTIGGGLDVYKPQFDSETLFFINKNNLSLWGLSLN